MLKIQIKYHKDENGKPLVEPMQKIEVGEWVDMRSAETVELKQGDFKLISLGVSMKLPDGYEANIVPRSSTFKNFGVLQTNSFGVIDSSYSGSGDIYKFPALAMRNTIINKGDRICQFRINKIQPEFQFEEVEFLEDTDRGGFGSTGIK